MTAEPTPSQTVGPFFAVGLPHPGGGDVVPAGTPGAVLLHGTVRDGAGEPLPDALLELWGPDPDGRVPGPGRGAGRGVGALARDGRTFSGFARVPTDRAGGYRVRTLLPGVPPGCGHAPHLAVAVFARGLLHHLFTRVYFPDHDHTGDPLLAALAPERRATLVAARADSALGPGYRFDVHLAGSDETVFLELIPDPAAG